MRDNLPKKIKEIECGVVNLDSEKNKGTHWVGYYKKDKKIVFYDSYGNLRPPTELIEYFHSNGNVDIYYNYENFQKFNSNNCGQLVVNFLYKFVH